MEPSPVTELPELIILENGLVLPSKEYIIAIHDMTVSFYIKTTGVGQLGIRDEACLEYPIMRLKNRKYDPDKKFENALKVSVELFYDIISKHPFIDGNKRTAWGIAIITLSMNFRSYMNKNYEIRESDEGEACLDISKWVDDADKAPLERRIREAGLVPPTQKRIQVEDVKRYIRYLLLKYVEMKS